MDRGAQWATVHGVTKSQTCLKGLSKHACIFGRVGTRCHQGQRQTDMWDVLRLLNFNTRIKTGSVLYNQLPVGISGFLCGSAGKESPCNAGDLGLIPGLGRSPGEGKGYPLHILAWRIPWTVHGVTNSWTQLSNFHFHISEATGIDHLHGLYVISGKKMIRTLAMDSNIRIWMLSRIRIL